jgi:hypothetical protein
MKIIEVEHEGTLAVIWKDCYQHQDKQTIAAAHPGQMVVLLSAAEFQRFKKAML